MLYQRVTHYRSTYAPDNANGADGNLMNTMNCVYSKSYKSSAASHNFIKFNYENIK